MKTKLRHTLVQYHGGGYDGCIWEWNFFYIDAEGEFHCIESTGHAGCDTAEKADALLALETNSPIDDYDGPPIHTYDVMVVEDIESFAKESNAVHVLGVLAWFNHYNDPDIEFFAICTECNECIFEDGILEDWRGCGGIATTADALLCSDCYSTGMCDVCNEYVGASDLTSMNDGHDTDNQHILNAEIQMIQDGYEYVCSDCLDYTAKQLESDEQGDLLSLSLATGTPDLFSDEMRWFWA